MNKLVGTTRRDLNKDVLNILRSIDSSVNNFDTSVLDRAAINICGNNNETQEEIVITNTVQPSTSTAQYNHLTSMISNDVQFKKEVANDQIKASTRSKTKFTKEEDSFLQHGMEKCGKGNWSQVLKDPAYRFNSCRTKDSLRMRAETASFKKSIDLTKM